MSSLTEVSEVHVYSEYDYEILNRRIFEMRVFYWSVHDSRQWLSPWVDGIRRI